MFNTTEKSITVKENIMCHVVAVNVSDDTRKFFLSAGTRVVGRALLSINDHVPGQVKAVVYDLEVEAGQCHQKYADELMAAVHQFMVEYSTHQGVSSEIHYTNTE